MNKAEFSALPLPVALGIIYELLPAIAALEAPRVPRSPQFDTRCRTRDGYTFASECDVGQLNYYINRTLQVSDPKYEEKNAKERKALKFFLEWRTVNPDARWRGERNHELVTAEAPSSRPKVYSWDAPAAVPAASESASDGYEDGGDGIPF